MALNDINYSKEISYFSHARAEMLIYIPKTAKTILEVGCGKGYFAKIVKENYTCEYWGIEPYIKIESNNIEYFDFIIEDKLGTELKLPDQYFDCIVINDVLEHLEYPEESLKYLIKKLKKNGYIISSIPNLRYAPYFYKLFFKGDFDYEESGIMDKTHLRFFTKKSILKMYERLGLKIISHEGINKITSIKYRLILRLLNYLTNNKYSDLYYLQYATVAKNE